MKTIKRISCLLLALALMMALSVTAFAVTGDANTKGSITVTNTVKDNSYSIYRIFDLESFNTEPAPDGAYSYKVNADWTNFINQATIKGMYVNLDTNGYVTWVTGASAADFAAKAIEYATAEATKINPVDTKTATADKEVIVFSDLPLGYYLVESSLGALCALDTTNPNATVIEKNSNPSLDKEVKEGNSWGKISDANIGDEVEFRATITVQGYAKDYVMHDQMDDGLTYKSVTSITLNEAPVAANDYTVNAPASDSHTFDVVFSDEFCNSLKTGDVIVVYYKATLNDNAVVKEAEVNKAHLEYKDNNGETHTTTDVETKTFTWELPVLKYANGDTSKVLPGAKFSLYTDEACTVAVKFHEVKVEGKTTVYRVDPAGTVTEITTDNTGKFRIEGLDAGTYYLKETEAPVGYNQLNTVVTVTIDHDGKINATESNLDGATQIEVENKAGVELPSTGGIGTTIFYVLGSVLLVGAAVLLITKKRMSAQK